MINQSPLPISKQHESSFLKKETEFM